MGWPDIAHAPTKHHRRSPSSFLFDSVRVSDRFGVSVLDVIAYRAVRATIKVGAALASHEGNSGNTDMLGLLRHEAELLLVSYQLMPQSRPVYFDPIAHLLRNRNELVGMASSPEADSNRRAAVAAF